MRLEKGEILVVGLDADGYEVSGRGTHDTLKDAKQSAKQLVQEPEAIAAGLVKVEVRNDKGECVADYFA